MCPRQSVVCSASGSCGLCPAQPHGLLRALPMHLVSSFLPVIYFNMHSRVLANSFFCPRFACSLWLLAVFWFCCVFSLFGSSDLLCFRRLFQVTFHHLFFTSHTLYSSRFFRDRWQLPQGVLVTKRRCTRSTPASRNGVAEHNVTVARAFTKRVCDFLGQRRGLQTLLAGQTGPKRAASWSLRCSWAACSTLTIV